MKYLEDILELIDDEFEDIVNNGRFKSSSEVHLVYELIDIAKDIYCIWAYESDGEYSETNARHEMHDRNRNGMSYRSKRSMRYSRNDAKTDFIDELTDLMHDTSDEETRRKIQSLIQHAERM